MKTNCVLSRKKRVRVTYWSSLKGFRSRVESARYRLAEPQMLFSCELDLASMVCVISWHTVKIRSHVLFVGETIVITLVFWCGLFIGFCLFERFCNMDGERWILPDSFWISFFLVSCPLVLTLVTSPAVLHQLYLEENTRTQEQISLYTKCIYLYVFVKCN